MKKTGKILRFPHARASSREASRASTSDVSPKALALSVAKIASHHSAGMLLRWPHFVTAVTGAPTSAAKAPSEGQSAMIAWNDVISDMADGLIGPSVLKSKANVSLDCELALGHTVRMAESETETEYKQRFIARVSQSRIARGLKQWQVSEAMGIPQDKYKQYESRSLMPHHMIGRFCIICRVDPEWLVTGRGKKPLKPLHVAATEPEPVAKPKRRRSSRAA